jgi:hypothetical protein
MGRERQEPILSSTCKGMDNPVSREQTAATINFKPQAKSDGCLKAAAAEVSAPLKRSARVRAREEADRAQQPPVLATKTQSGASGLPSVARQLFCELCVEPCKEVRKCI